MPRLGTPQALRRLAPWLLRQRQVAPQQLQRLVRLEEPGDLQGWLVQGMLITSERTPASWSNSALPSVVSRMRFVAAAVAAIIKS